MRVKGKRVLKNGVTDDKIRKKRKLCFLRI